MNLEMNESIYKNNTKVERTKNYFDFSTVDPRNFVPTPIHIKFYEAAKFENTIICHENEKLKTFISIRLLKHFTLKTKQEICKKIVFVEVKDSSIDLRKKIISNNSDLKILSIKKFSEFDEDKFLDEKFLPCDLVICKPDILIQIIEKKFFSLENISLLSFNDIHKIYENLDCLKLIKIYENLSDKPRIVGFCISLINNETKFQKLNLFVKKLEKNFLSKCKTSISTYYNKPKEIIVKFKKYEQRILKSSNFHISFELISSLISFIETSKIKSKIEDNNILKNVKVYIFEFINVLQTMGFWCANRLAQLYSLELAELVAIYLDKDRNYASALSALLSLFNYLSSLIEIFLNNYSYKDQLVKLASTKLRSLIYILKENRIEIKSCLDLSNKQEKSFSKKNLNKENYYCIIFVKKKEISNVLSLYLNEISKLNINDCNFLKVEYVYWEKRITNNLDEIRSNKKQNEILMKFKNREFNTLIMNSYFEERLDIPKCKLVIRYDLPFSSKEYIQSKERTRSENSKLVFLVDEINDLEKLCKLIEFVKQEKFLIEKCKDDFDEDDKNVLENNNELIKEIEKKIKPFKPDSSKKSLVTANLMNSIAIINRYCLRLPSDSFTKLFPFHKINTKYDENNSILYQCELYLPINSPIRFPIKSEFTVTKKLAKRMCALKFCEILYKFGELDEKFLPVCKENIKLIDESMEVSDQDNEVRLTIGTTKKRRYYNKRISKVLYGDCLKPNQKFYFYIFKMNLTCPIPEEQNTRGRKITDPADYNKHFGLVILHKIPKICKFPIYTRSGEVMVDLKQISSDNYFDEQQFEKIVEFHKFIFKNVLKLEKYPMKFDYSKSKSTYLIVPINYDIKVDDSNLNKAKIDWEMVEIIQNYNKDLFKNENNLNLANNEKFIFKKELYEDAVVLPKYHKSENQFYFYVAVIMEDYNPLSSFANNAYNNFLDYYKSKYNVNITNLEQPLLDVDYTSARLNLLTPRYVNRKGITLPMSTAKTKKQKRHNIENKQLLIPEICVVHPFSASFWKKTVCLPSILFRLNCLLLAEELRIEVAKETKIGKIDLNEDEEWPALDFGWTLAEVLEKNNCSNSQTNMNHTILNLNSNSKSNLTYNKILENELSNVVSKEKINFPQEKNNLDKKKENDFVIDTFDVSKYKIEEKNDFIMDESDSNIYNTNNMNNFNSNNLLYESSKCFNSLNNVFNSSEEVNSNSTKKSVWTSYLNENPVNVLDVGTDGLTSISGIGNFNFNALSRDLALITEQKSTNLLDNFDSDEEDEISFENLEEEEAAEFDPSYKQNINSKKQLLNNHKDEFLFDILTNGLIFKNIIYDTEISELTTMCDNVYEMNEYLELDENSEFEMIDLNYFEIIEFNENNELDFNLDSKNKNLVDLNYFVNELKNIIGLENNNQIVLESKSIRSNEKNLIVQNQIIQKLDDFQLSFGELLPVFKTESNQSNQIKSIFENVDNDCKINFNIKFDTYKNETENYGPEPALILQALTMSNASDGINLERLETIGDSFLKYAVTAYLFCVYDKIHEGKLSHLRSKHISNYNLFRLGQKKCLGEIMVANKFEPSDNWLPPGFVIPKGLEEVLIDLSCENSRNTYNLNVLKEISFDDLSKSDLRKEIEKHKSKCITSYVIKENNSDEEETFDKKKNNLNKKNTEKDSQVSYNLLTQHSIPDKSIADCVESLIGAYLISNGPKSAILFMKWLGLKIMPDCVDDLNQDQSDPIWHWLPPIQDFTFSKLCENFDSLSIDEKQTFIEEKKKELDVLYYGSNLNRFEEILKYKFKNKVYLVQAFIHNSFYNTVTDCYQRLEFLGDAILDFLITRYLYEDPKKYSPGVLTDLRSALVNNTFFASLAVKYDFQKYLKVLSTDLLCVINNFVNKFNQKSHWISSVDYVLCMEEGECDNNADVEVPKVLGDVFESVAGAIYLDSGYSLDTVWNVYFRMMKPEIEYFRKNFPKSPIRELLELKPQNLKFSNPEIIKEKKISVIVEIFGEDSFVGIGRNKRIAKCAAAKKALRSIKEKERQKQFLSIL